MKKYSFCWFAVIAICFITFNSCNSKKSDQGNVSQNGVTMTVSPDNYEAVPDMVKLTIVNNSGHTIEYGAGYIIEKKQGNNWVEMSFSSQLAFIDILYIQPSGEVREYDINLYPDLALDEYNIGNYRVRKNIFVDNQNEIITAGFKIK